MRKHIFYNTVNFQPVTFRILFFRGIQTLQMRLSRKACFWWTQLLRPFCRAADEFFFFFLLACLSERSTMRLTKIPLLCLWGNCRSPHIPPPPPPPPTERRPAIFFRAVIAASRWLNIPLKKKKSCVYTPLHLNNLLFPHDFENLADLREQSLINLK